MSGCIHIVKASSVEIARHATFRHALSYWNDVVGIHITNVQVLPEQSEEQAS